MVNNEINGYRKLKGQIITVMHKIYMSDHSQHVEYVQGVLRNVEDGGIEIEQYLTLFDYLDGANPPSKIRRFGFRDIVFSGNLPA